MSVFHPVEKKIDFPASENHWAEFWREHDIFTKQLAQGAERSKAEGKSTYVFYEGPPTANGLPHPGHVLTRVIKDLFPRFRAMQGYDVPRKAGWDTHGLPVEIEVEKDLNINGKQGIEEFGVESFVKKCKDSVFRYADVWRTMTERIGFWLDLDDPYVTYEQSYIESVWWSLKQFWDAGLLYHGAKIVPWCPRCGTALSSHEVGQGYREVADPSAYVAFRSAKDSTLMFLAWTTTPWTLLSNVALAVGHDFDYDYAKVGDETIVVAASLRESVFGKIPHEVVRTVKGSELVGEEYEQLFPFSTVDKPAFRIVAGDFVGLKAGSGIVHIAPAYGEDDYLLARAHDLPTINLVNTDGTFKDAVEPWKGMFVKDTDKLIIRALKDRKQLLKSEQYTHDYPFCWRCESPLLYYPRPTWYLRTSDYKEQMLANNAKIKWHPEHIQNGRFGNFLATNVDWALSRERYWGTPLPIWQCTDAGCGHNIAIGSQRELIERGIDVPADIELHKPYVDEVELTCEKCNGRMRRVPEVIDCWYDSGSMPFAQWGYPHAAGSAAALTRAFPADFISEAIDQTRGWFYSMLAISTLLQECAKKKAAAGESDTALKPFLDVAYPFPYRRCLVLGLLLAEDGTKLSKRLKNYPNPNDVFAREGADAMRWFFYYANNPWTSTRFFAGAIRETQKDFLLRLRNVYSFFVIYANIDGFDPRIGNAAATSIAPATLAGAADYVAPGERPLLDRWLLSKLAGTVRTVTLRLEELDVLRAAQSLYGFVDLLSNWYVRRSRDRFWTSTADAHKTSAYWTLYESLTQLALLIAPMTPFFAEELYQKLARDLWPESLPESVHLCAWPEAEAADDAPAIEEQMDLVREIASLGLAARASKKLKVRQPLAQAVVILQQTELTDKVEVLGDVIREEINVKELVFAVDASAYVEYSIKPNFATLGPRLGKNVRACATALAECNAAEMVSTLQESGSIAVEVGGAVIALAEGDVDVRINAKDGFSAAGGRGVVVVLDTNITEALLIEGIARELINRIQGIRKELDLKFEDRIAVRLGTGGKVARAAIHHGESIAAETLATDYQAVYEEIGSLHEVTIADEAVRISVKRIS